ncbi:MAG: DUF853 family protein [Paludibacteraceae bacterium]|nr:DUF853 family protein [Paludibacteraceae bacterium]MBR5972494.1 DUF853 family protein [Paludibacteraceae bacterium]
MINSEEKLYVAHSDHPLVLEPKMANRHGLIAGATGTGKTVSLQVLAESFSDLGVPCFMADMKGDLSGVYKAGELTKFIAKRQEQFGVTFEFQPYPTQFFDVYGEQGHPMRVTIKDFGVLLFSRIMSLTDTQEGVLNAVFRICEDKNMPLDDLKDLRAALNYIGQNAKEFQTEYGNISSVSVGSIQRNLLALEEQGGNQFFGLPEFDIDDFFSVEKMNGIKKGMINILAADKLYNNPKLYSAFLMWLLTTIYNKLPEVGDMDKPKFIFFFDEAHLLFDDASKALMEQIEKVVRLIRSKGVGVYFITQNPMDIPENVLGQLGNKIQHALRAFTPKDQKAVKAVAQSFRANESFDTEKALLELETGEALISFLDEKGAPTIVERAKMLCPQGQIGPITEEERRTAIKESGLEKKYGETVERESAYEMLIKESEKKKKEEEERRAQELAEKEEAKRKKEEEKEAKAKAKKSASSSTTWYGKALTSIAKTLGNKLVNEVIKKMK